MSNNLKDNFKKLVLTSGDERPEPLATMNHPAPNANIHSNTRTNTRTTKSKCQQMFLFERNMTTGKDNIHYLNEKLRKEKLKVVSIEALTSKYNHFTCALIVLENI